MMWPLWPNEWEAAVTAWAERSGATATILRFPALVGAGMAGKVLNNYVAGCAASAVRQAIEWGEAMDIPRDRLLAMMHDSSGQTWFGSRFPDIEFSRDGYAPDNTVHILQKDVAAALDGAGAEDDALGRAAIDKMRAWKPI